MRDAERGELPEAEEPRQDTKTGASRVPTTTRATACTQEVRRSVRNEGGGPARCRDVNESMNEEQVNRGQLCQPKWLGVKILGFLNKVLHSAMCTCANANVPVLMRKVIGMYYQNRIVI